MAVITSNLLGKELERAGVVHDIDTIQRIVVDLCADEPVKVYVQRVGRPGLAEVLPDLLVDVEVVET